MYKYIGGLHKEYFIDGNKEIILQNLQRLIEQSSTYKQGSSTYNGFHLIANQSIKFDFVHKPIYEVILKLKQEQKQILITAKTTNYIEHQIVAVILLLLTPIFAIIVLYHYLITPILETRIEPLIFLSFFCAFTLFSLWTNKSNKNKGLIAVDALILQLQQQQNQ